jgi:hypothetical protein
MHTLNTNENYNSVESMHEACEGNIHFPPYCLVDGVMKSGTKNSLAEQYDMNQKK